MPAVLVHGVPETPAVWDLLRAQLKRADVIALQLPGFGCPRPAGFGATKEEYVAWLVGELEQIAAQGPIDLVVIVAHMGHPYEELLMNYMRKWPNLYVSCTAYAPRYMDPALVAFMNTKTYRGRVIWGSDEPWFPMRRSLTEARALPLDDDAMAQFLGVTARKLLDRTAR